MSSRSFLFYWIINSTHSGPEDNIVDYLHKTGQKFGNVKFFILNY